MTSEAGEPLWKLILRRMRARGRSRGWSSKCSPTGPRIVGARSLESLRPSATVTHLRHCSSYAYKHQPPKRPDPYDNAMAASVVGLCNTELIRKKGPWRDLDVLEYATLEYVDWFSHRRPRPPKPNASPCLPPPSSPGTPPTSVQLSTTVYQHINLYRRYDVTNTTTLPPSQLRPLTAAQTDAFCTDAGSTPTPEPKVVTAPPNRHRQQPRTRHPNPDRRFRSPLQSHGSSTRHSSKQHWLDYLHR